SACPTRSSTGSSPGSPRSRRAGTPGRRASWRPCSVGPRAACARMPSRRPSAGHGASSDPGCSAPTDGCSRSVLAAVELGPGPVGLRVELGDVGLGPVVGRDPVFRGGVVAVVPDRGRALAEPGPHGTRGVVVDEPLPLQLLRDVLAGLLLDGGGGLDPLPDLGGRALVGLARLADPGELLL